MNVPSVKVKSDSLNSIFKTFKEITHLGNDTMTNLDSILKSRDITLPTKVCLVKAIVFPVVMYGCEQRYNVRCLDSWGDSSLGPRCPKVGGPWELSFEQLKSLGSQVGERKWQTRQNCRSREAVTRLIWRSIRSAVEGEGGVRARFQPRCQEGIWVIADKMGGTRMIGTGLRNFRLREWSEWMEHKWRKRWVFRGIWSSLSPAYDPSGDKVQSPECGFVA